ncbi:MAG: hypothetical protein ACRCV6_04835 [Formosimonas sp.]
MKKQIKQADWVSNINSAATNGKLGICADGNGLCAILDKKQYRLDK